LASAFIANDPDMDAVVKLILARVFTKQVADVRETESVFAAGPGVPDGQALALLRGDQVPVPGE